MGKTNFIVLLQNKFYSFITKQYYMNITSITFILQLLHILQSIYICITHFTSVVKNDHFCNVWAGNQFNVHEDV